MCEDWCQKMWPVQYWPARQRGMEGLCSTEPGAANPIEWDKDTLNSKRRWMDGWIIDLLKKSDWPCQIRPDSVFFICPFEKRTYYAMAMSVRLSVRPSVRPSFPDFFSTCFEISIWNLVYAFSRWHDMSSLSFITIGSLWPSLQPKVGQTQFLQSWPYKSR